MDRSEFCTRVRMRTHEREEPIHRVVRHGATDDPMRCLPSVASSRDRRTGSHWRVVNAWRRRWAHHSTRAL